MLSRIYSFCKMVVFAGIIFAFGVLLFSYHPMDASFNTVSSTVAENWLGCFGSYFADIFMQAFGYVSWLLFAFLFACFLFKVMHKERSFLCLKRIICVFLVFLFCLLLGQYDKGGFIGTLIYRYLPPFPEALYVLLWVISVCGLIFVLDIPVKRIALKFYYYGCVIKSKLSSKSDKI